MANLTLHLLLLTATTSVGCAQPIRAGAIIDRYHGADCLNPGPQQSGRAWATQLRIREGEEVHVSGRQVPGGRIDVRFEPDGHQEVAADAGDYIYPSDVRFQRIGNRLYIRAEGRPAVFGGQQTWLFEYDLERRRRTGRVRVVEGVLSQVCQGK
jgi:hypothetical protein